MQAERLINASFLGYLARIVRMTKAAWSIVRTSGPGYSLTRTFGSPSTMLSSQEKASDQSQKCKSTFGTDPML
jgi:hypothetical protein